MSRNVLVTGASRGLGRAIAEGFWHHGDDLLLVARSAAALAGLAEELQATAAQGQQVHVFEADLAADGAASRVMHRACNLWDRLDVLVNNAGMIGPIGCLWENDWEQWQLTIRVNLLVPVELCRAAAAWMIPRGSGKIINISGGGATSPRPHFSAYATAKAGLVRFSETLAVELAEHHIQVNAIAPGAMNTAMHQAVLEAGADRAGKREFAAAVEQDQRGGVPPVRAAELCVFLASEAAAGISGRLISAVWDDWPSLAEKAGVLASGDIYTLRRIVPKDRGLQW